MLALTRRRACAREVEVQQDAPILLRVSGADQRRGLLEAGGSEVGAAEVKPDQAGAVEKGRRLRSGVGDAFREAGHEEELRRRLPNLRLGNRGLGAPRREVVVGAVDARVPEAEGEVPYLEPERPVET